MVPAAQPVDSSILHEIVRVIEARSRVPGRVAVRAREYQITYLEDHQRRLEEAIQRHDADRINMLYGQLASKVKYQLLRRLPEKARAKKRPSTGNKPAAARQRRTVKARTSARKRVAAKKRTGSGVKRTVPKSRAPAKKRHIHK